MQGQIFKIHSDFYYVKSVDGNVFECKLREVLKKQNQRVLTGDFVEFDQAGAIFNVLERKNSLPRPAVSNIDLVVVVSSLLEPKLDFVQLNRYLTFLKYYKHMANCLIIILMYALYLHHLKNHIHHILNILLLP